MALIHSWGLAHREELWFGNTCVKLLQLRAKVLLPFLGEWMMFYLTFARHQTKEK